MGASRWRIFREVTLPMAWPGIKRALVLVFIMSLTDFGNPLILGRDTPVLAGIIYDEITLTSDKTAINTHMFIDDRPENFQALDAAGVEVYLRRQRWNQHLHAARAVETFTDYANKVVAKAQNT